MEKTQNNSKNFVIHNLFQGAFSFFGSYIIMTAAKR